MIERGVFSNSVRKRSGTDSSRRETAAIWTPAAQPSVRAVRSSTSAAFSSIPNSSMTAATSALREPEVGVAHLEQLPVRTQSVQRELGLSAAADDHATVGRQAFDERGHAGCRSRRELKIVDHDHDRFAERREVVHDRDRDITERRFRLAQQVGCIEPAVGPPANKRIGQRGPKCGRIGVALVARKPD